MFDRKRSQPAHERTAEERQRAREERERRRQGSPPPPAGLAPPAGAAPREVPASSEHAELAERPTPAAHVETGEPSPPPPATVELPAMGEASPGAPREAPPETPPETPPEAPPEAPQPAPSPPAVATAPPDAPIEPSAPVPVSTRQNPRMQRRVEKLRERRGTSQRWYRRLPARLGALLALLAVGGVIWLLVQSLGGSGSHTPPPAPRVTKVTIPEGYTRAMIAALAKDEGLKGDYLAASVRSSLLAPTRYGAPHGTPNLEGFLFPATYDLYAGASVRRLIGEQLAAFQENFGADEARRAHALGVTPYQLLVVASMIEREAEVQRDRPLIAAVIYNRLHQGIPLGIDATIRYALNDFSKPLTEAQLRDPSPYNTRLHRGLPPTPIANPGNASIQAAAHPAHVSYVYYVAAADGCGEHVFSSSYAQFEHDAAAYREAVARNHGRVPTCPKKR